MKKIYVYMIRHGATPGNLERRYVGSTDEDLTTEAVTALKNKRISWENADCEQLLHPAQLWVSPLRRCIQTAQCLFPDTEPIWVDGFRECSFGVFEYMNYEELNGNPLYQKFIDSGGMSGFPGGEDRATFTKRVVEAFRNKMEQSMQTAEDADTIVMVVHGGTIMALLDTFSAPHGDYYDWQVENGAGYRMEWNGSSLSGMEKI